MGQLSPFLVSYLARGQEPCVEVAGGRRGCEGLPWAMTDTRIGQACPSHLSPPDGCLLSPWRLPLLLDASAAPRVGARSDEARPLSSGRQGSLLEPPDPGPPHFPWPKYESQTQICLSPLRTFLNQRIGPSGTYSTSWPVSARYEETTLPSVCEGATLVLVPLTGPAMYGW